MLELSESIDVWVLFRKGQIQPSVFFWKTRQIKIEKINLVHTTKNGNSPSYHFSVSSGENFYRLGFNPDDLKWFLEAVEEE
jgi:hypothetical protein